MWFLFEILIYASFAFIMSWLARKACLADDNDCRRLYDDADGDDVVQSPCFGRWNSYLTLYVLFFTIVGGLRWNVGSDSLSYAYLFTLPEHGGPAQSGNQTELIFAALKYVVGALSLHPSFGLAAMAFIQIFFLTKALQRYKWMLVFVPFVLFGGCYWSNLMGACRQMMAACVFMWAIRFIATRQFALYMACVAACYLIHHSALLLIPVYFLPVKLRLLDRRVLLCAIVLACCVIGQTPAFAALGGYVESLSMFMGYDNYATTFSTMLTEGYSSEKLSFGPMMLSYLLIPLFIIWYGPHLEEEYADKIPEFYLWYNLALFYACGYFLVCNISHIFIRPFLYFLLPQMFMAALLLKYLVDRYRENSNYQIACVIFCVVISLNTAWDVTKSSGQLREFATYKTVLTNGFWWLR